MKKERIGRDVNKALYAKMDEYKIAIDILNSNGEFSWELTEKYYNVVKDTRYWGVFYKKQKDSQEKMVLIDPKRFFKMTDVKITENQLKVINARYTHYFHPKRKENDYNCNLIVGDIKTILRDWIELQYPLIQREVSRIKKPELVEKPLMPGDYYNFQCGVSGIGAAQAWSNFMNYQNANINQHKIAQYEWECANLERALFAQFFQGIASKMEAAIVKLLKENNLLTDRFDRNILYATALGKDKKVEELKDFKWLDKIYCLWHFLKHNTLSTYNTLKERYPELLNVDKHYEQGELAMYFVKFSNEMVIEILNGCIEFFKEYCELIFGEKYEEAQWNYSQYFISIMKAKQREKEDEWEDLNNPLGLQWWDDID